LTLAAMLTDKKEKAQALIYAKYFKTMEYQLIVKLKKVTPITDSKADLYIIGIVIAASIYFMWDIYKCR